jgi:formylglycine-generating enzyme required for sulfatase activity
MNVDDGNKIVADIAQYKPNAWGLFDMHGNVSEWTRSICRAYPYDLTDGLGVTRQGAKKVVRGGSWRDRPARATSFYRLAYEPYQKVFNVGFRVVIEADSKDVKSRLITAK